MFVHVQCLEGAVFPVISQPQLSPFYVHACVLVVFMIE